MPLPNCKINRIPSLTTDFSLRHPTISYLNKFFFSFEDKSVSNRHTYLLIGTEQKLCIYMYIFEAVASTSSTSAAAKIN